MTYSKAILILLLLSVGILFWQKYTHTYVAQIPFDQSNSSEQISNIPLQATAFQATETPAQTTPTEAEIVPEKPTPARETPNGESYLVFDLTRNKTLSEKNSEKILPIASVTKLMTALVTLSYGGNNDMVTISKDAIETREDRGNLIVNTSIPASTLLYPLLIESSNDAAEALAEHYGRDEFINKMNTTAQTIGMTKTFFEDPTGLSANNTSTAHDLAALVTYIKKHQSEILSITKEKTYTYDIYTWQSYNQFLDDTGYLGGKSGYTSAAQETDVALFKDPKTKHTFIIVILGTDNRYIDTMYLYQKYTSTE